MQLMISHCSNKVGDGRGVDGNWVVLSMYGQPSMTIHQLTIKETRSIRISPPIVGAEPLLVHQSTPIVAYSNPHSPNNSSATASTWLSHEVKLHQTSSNFKQLKASSPFRASRVNTGCLFSLMIKITSSASQFFGSHFGSVKMENHGKLRNKVTQQL